MMKRKRLYFLINLSMLTVIGLIIWTLEEFIPRPLPFIKFGFANLVSLVVLVLYGYKEALLVTFLRIVLANIITGKIGTPSILISLSAGMVSISIVSLYYYIQDGLFSLIGLSILGAFFHNIVQFAVVSVVVTLKRQIFYLFPFFAVSSIMTGGIVGLLAGFSLKYVSPLAENFGK